MEGYLKVHEVARVLDVHTDTARRYVREGIIPSVFIGNSYRVQAEDVEHFIERRRRGSTEQEAAAAPIPLGEGASTRR